MRIGAAGKWFGAGMVGATFFCTALCASLCLSFSTTAKAQQLDQKVGQQFDQKLYSEMRWRCIGPFRGGRAVAVSGGPRHPNIFYMAAVNGGVWKTTDFGKHWDPVFCDPPNRSGRAPGGGPAGPRLLFC